MRRFFLFLFCLFPVLLWAQKDSTASMTWQGGFGLQAGIGVSKLPFVDVGIAHVKDAVRSIHPLEKASYLSTEVYIGKHPFVAPKLGVWAAGGASVVGLGAAALYYTDFSKGRFVLRPEAGFSVACFRLHYGYNFSLGKSGFSNFAQNVVGMTLWFNRQLWGNNRGASTNTTAPK